MSLLFHLFMTALISFLITFTQASCEGSRQSGYEKFCPVMGEA